MFSTREHAAAELKAVLPASLIAEMDFSTLELVPGTFVDDLHAETHSDLLYKVKLSGEDTLIYKVFEHQSATDEIMPLRVLGYAVRVLSQYARSRASPALASGDCRRAPPQPRGMDGCA